MKGLGKQLDILSSLGIKNYILKILHSVITDIKIENNIFYYRKKDKWIQTGSVGGTITPTITHFLPGSIPNILSQPSDADFDYYVTFLSKVDFPELFLYGPNVNDNVVAINNLNNDSPNTDNVAKCTFGSIYTTDPDDIIRGIQLNWRVNKGVAVEDLVIRDIVIFIKRYQF